MRLFVVIIFDENILDVLKECLLNEYENGF